MDPLADLAIFFVDSMATVTIGAVTVPALFNSPSKVLNVFDTGVNSTAPSIVMKSSDVTANNVDNGKSVTIAGAGSYNGIYTVLEVDSDGFGLSLVTLGRG